MLNIYGSSSGKLCDGVARRDFLRVGALGRGTVALPQLLEAEALAGIGKSHKAVIMIYLVGAPPHQDMFDLKTNAPSEVRGPFRPIKTKVPGIEICEHLPRLARIMDKLVPLRSVYGSPDGDHDSFICYTGRSDTTASVTFVFQSGTAGAYFGEYVQRPRPPRGPEHLRHFQCHQPVK